MIKIKIYLKKKLKDIAICPLCKLENTKKYEIKIICATGAIGVPSIDQSSSGVAVRSARCIMHV